jgi:chromosome segregation ATPase
MTSTITKEFISDRTIAERLELFEKNLVLEQKNEELQAEIRSLKVAHVEEISSIKHSSADPVQTAIAMLQGYTDMQNQLKQKDAEIAEAHAAIETVKSEKSAIYTELNQAVNVLTLQKNKLDTFDAGMEKLANKLEETRIILKSRDNDLKELRALNPLRLQKQVKNLQQKNRELQEANDKLKLLNKDTQAKTKEQEKRAEAYFKENQTLNRTLDELIKLNENGELNDIIHEDDNWQLIGHTDATNKINIMCKRSGVMRVFDRKEGMIKPANIPQSIKDIALVKLETYSQIASEMNKYKNGEV